MEEIKTLILNIMRSQQKQNIEIIIIVNLNERRGGGLKFTSIWSGQVPVSLELNLSSSYLDNKGKYPRKIKNINIPSTKYCNLKIIQWILGLVLQTLI